MSDDIQADVVALLERIASISHVYDDTPLSDLQCDIEDVLMIAGDLLNRIRLTPPSTPAAMDADERKP